MNEAALPSTEGTGAAVRFQKARLNPIEASEYLALQYDLIVAVATLATMRVRGGGPAFLKPGRAVLYPRDEVDRWALERLGAPRRSTSEDVR